MKKLLNLEGVKALSKMEQMSILGGLHDFAIPGCVESGNGCLTSSSNSDNLCCPELTCQTSGSTNLGICR